MSHEDLTGSSLPGAMHRVAPIGAILFVAIAALSSIASLSREGPAANGSGSFSAQRAMVHVKALAASPRPAGSAGHRAARDYIVSSLRTAGVKAEVRTSTATSTRYLPYDAARVHNIVALIPGTDPSRRIVLTAHYDTMLTSPGAGDDASGVATLLEAGRALAVEYRGGPDVMLLFTGAEEIGALGAEAFLASDRFDVKRMTVLNFDSRGTHGPTGLIETAGNEGSLVRAVARAIAQSGAPVAMTSLLPALAQLHGVGTDFRPFRDLGARGLNFAIVDGVARYHTPADSPEALDVESVRRQGEAAVALVRALGDGTDDRAGTVSYFTAPIVGLVVYPRFLDLIAAVLATALFVYAIAMTVRRRRAAATNHPRAWVTLGASALVSVAAVSLAAAACHYAWRLVRMLGAGPPPGLADPYDPVAFRFAAVLLATGTALGVARLARRAGVTSPTSMMPAIGVAVLWALALRLPGAAYLLAIPMLVIALHASFQGRNDKPLVRAITAAAVLLPLAIVWAPVPYFVLAGFRLSAAWAAGAVTAFGVLLCASVFERARFAIDGRVVAMLLALAGAATAVGVAGAETSPQKPRPVSFAYALDADAGRAFWVSDRRSAERPRDTMFSALQPLKTLPRFLGEDGVLARAASADPLPLPAPDIALVRDARVNGRRQLTLRVRSRRNAPWLHVFVESGKVLSAIVDDVPFQPRAGDADAADGALWAFRHIGAGEESFALKLDVDPAAGPVRITAVDQSSGIDHPLGRLPSDAMYARSWIAGTTLVRRSRVF